MLLFLYFVLPLTRLLHSDSFAHSRALNCLYFLNVSNSRMALGVIIWWNGQMDCGFW